jgi:TPR repeat protein
MTFESRHPTADAQLVELSSVDMAKLSDEEAQANHLRVLNAAQSGSAFAMCICATWPGKQGRHKPTDEERYYWAERAARTNYPPGLFELGRCYETGVGTRVDLEEAQALYSRSATTGYGLAAYRLGEAFIGGQFGVLDAPKAVSFMEMACHLGESLGALTLAQWLESGESVKQDLAAAIAWYEQASAMGSFFATHRLQLAYMRGELGLTRDLEKARLYETRFLEQTDVGSPHAAT